MNKKCKPGCKPVKWHCGPSNFLLVLLICVGLCVGTSWVVNAAAAPVVATRLSIQSAGYNANHAPALVAAGWEGDQVAGWRFSTSNQSIAVYKLKIREVANENAGANLKNFRLEVDNVPVGPTIERLTEGGNVDYVVFSSDVPLFVIPPAGVSEVILRVDGVPANESNAGLHGTRMKFRLTNSTRTYTANSDISAKNLATGKFISGANALNSDSNIQKYVRSHASTAIGPLPDPKLIPQTDFPLMQFAVVNFYDESIVYKPNLHNIRFTITSFGGGNCSGRGCDVSLYDALTGARLGGPLRLNLRNRTAYADFKDLDFSVPAEGNKNLILKVNTADFASAGDSIQARIDNTAADFCWGDNKQNSSYKGTGYGGLGLTLNGQTFVKN